MALFPLVSFSKMLSTAEKSRFVQLFFYVFFFLVLYPIQISFVKVNTKIFSLDYDNSDNFCCDSLGCC